MYDEIDVRELGAVGDGAADDTEALQRAIDLSSETGRAVRLRPGRYRCRTLFIKPQTVLYAEPTWGFRADACGQTVIVQAEEDMVCQLDLTEACESTLRGLSLLGTGTGRCAGMLSRKKDYGQKEDAYRIEDCCVSRYGGHAVFLDHIWCFSVRHCQFGHCGGDGLRVNGWDGFVLDNWFSGNAGAGYYGEQPNASVTLTGNRIEWNAAGGIVAVGGSHYNITGNYIDRSGRAALDLRRMHTVACTGNVFYRSGKYQENDPEAAQCILEDCRGVTFMGNAVKHGRDDNAQGVLTPARSMRLARLTDCVVSGNTMYKGSTQQLIDDRGGHENCVIEANVGRVSAEL